MSEDNWRWAWLSAAVLLVVAMAMAATELFALSRVEATPQRGWSVPAKVSNGPAGSTASWPGLAVTGCTTVTVVWQDDRLGSVDDLYFTASGDCGRSWPVQDGVVYTSTQKSELPKLTRESDGTVHAVWSWVVGPSTTTRNILYSYRADGDWSSPVAVVTATEAVEPAVAVDSTGKIHVVWDNKPELVNQQVYYSQSSDGLSWSSPHKLSGGTGASAGPAIAVDEDDDVHVVWWNTTGISFYVLYNTGDGTPGDWQATPTELGSTTLPYVHCYPDVACATGGNVHVVWCEWMGGNASQQVKYRERSGSGWDTPETIPGSQLGVKGLLTTYILPKVASGVSDDPGPFVVWHGSAQPDVFDENIHFAERSDGGWISGCPVYSNPYVRQMTPDLDVDPQGKLHVVWQQERNGDEYDIYHSFSLNNRISLPLFLKRHYT